MLEDELKQKSQEQPTLGLGTPLGVTIGGLQGFIWGLYLPDLTAGSEGVGASGLSDLPLLFMFGGAVLGGLVGYGIERLYRGR